MPTKEIPSFGEYKCSKCKSTWNSSKSFENASQKCRICNTEVMATNQRPLKNAKKMCKTEDEMHLKGIGPFFGEFHCKKCQKHWMSAYCWFENDKKTKVPQKCKRCNVNTFAIKMRSLEKSNSEITKPHQSELCGKCQKLGFSCERLKLKSMTKRFSAWRI
ncbi:zygote arrest protein 1-like [Bradysia coprophila]|uniref:zygote arrest protein 1-like n=1 Tax=Bradysia coprophila TaxID=38358 RepID=UPI00187D8502|nr:zygote arrest protein 1-like [Bradysia coprophila]